MSSEASEMKRSPKRQVREWPLREKTHQHIDLNTTPPPDRSHPLLEVSGSSSMLPRYPYDIFPETAAHDGANGDALLCADYEAFTEHILAFLSSDQIAQLMRHREDASTVITVLSDDDDATNTNYEVPVIDLEQPSSSLPGNVLLPVPIVIPDNEDHSERNPAVVELQAAAPREPTFACPICMSEFVEPSSTICGHIFCKECIATAIKVQKKCPTCRRKLRKNNFHRVYLPTAE